MQRIFTFPDDILKQVAAPVRAIDGTLAAFLDEMAQTMYAAPGVGLAAPQVGLSERAIVLDCDSAEERAEGRGRGLLRLINPEIVEAEGSILWEEGCLSVVDFTAEVKRASRVLEPVGAGRADEPEVDTRPVHDAVERVEHPPPGEHRQRRGDDPRQQDGAPDQPLEARSLQAEGQEAAARGTLRGSRFEVARRPHLAAGAGL